MWGSLRVTRRRGNRTAQLVVAIESVQFCRARQNRVVDILFRDRADAGRQLAAALDSVLSRDMVVVGLARGGVPVAVEVCRSFALPLDALAVRKVGHPSRPEYGIGGVTPSGGVYVRADEGLMEDALRKAIELARSEAEALDAVLHRDLPPIDPAGKSVLLVDDGLATGATMIAAVRWARNRGAARAIVAVPVAAASSIGLLQHETEDVVCPHILQRFVAVGHWYRNFAPVSNESVIESLYSQGIGSHHS
jgi:putative phosphoribosyl transferase